MKVPSGSKSFVITGGTSGIGRGITMALAEPGRHLVLLGRSPAGLSSLVHDVQARGARATAVGCDLGDLHQVARATVDIARACEGTAIAGLVNNAGLQQRRPTRTAQGVDATFAVNYLAPLVLTEALVPHFDPGASVLFLGSGTEDPEDRGATRFGFRGARYLSAQDAAQGRWAPGGSAIPGQDAYATSKLCCILLARQLAREIDPARVRFIAFDPGLVPGTGLAREVSGVLQFAWQHVLPRLAPMIPGWSTPLRAGRVVRDILSNAELPSGAHLDDGGAPKRGSTMARDDALAARVVSEGRALVERLIAPAAGVA